MQIAEDWQQQLAQRETVGSEGTHDQKVIADYAGTGGRTQLRT
ncbi:hypothetical protein PhaeoP23_03189 [Phaeobacter piscinae]|uniref:Uncharacterized protein n=1 Tax=Phaeobacter piscinae TaxID=1580596 RepID=A0ABM6PHL1_9RHOB|nr:hypothetical protein PhaeoP36_03189 [Phaeobacter piscinae]ATG41211.1 hypothetical protein PhaeoP14_03170 [Phaeobacter piscinae]AUQ87796.1 hypothetical protein PhaeoP42_03190 [Phaeobacter piscinae]AUR25679.1 hypothetical protein PhaeoP23_03189 [Phaeobacter piscinae]